MPIEGTDLPIWGMEIDADEARRRFKSSSADGKSSKASIQRPILFYASSQSHVEHKTLHDQHYPSNQSHNTLNGLSFSAA